VFIPQHGLRPHFARKAPSIMPQRGGGFESQRSLCRVFDAQLWPRGTPRAAVTLCPKSLLALSSRPVMSESGCPSDSNLDRLLRAVAITSFFLIVIALCLFRVKAIDFGWHLKAGEYIWTTKSIPTHDIFSYVLEGSRWVDSHWLFQLILYGFHALGGIPGVTVLRAALIVATFALLLSTVYRKEYLLLAILVCLLALFSSHHRYLVRPELVSFLFLAAFSFCVQKVSAHPRSFMVTIFLCQMLWANMHGLHAIGIVLIGLYFVGDAAQLLSARSFPRISDVEMTARELKLNSGLLAAVLLASLMNANGIDGILYPYKIFSQLRGEVASFPELIELRPTFSIPGAQLSLFHPIMVYKVFLCVSVLSWLGQWRRIRFAHALIYIAFLYLSILAERNVALFAVVATPITIRNLNASLDSVLAKGGVSVAPQRGIALATAFATIIMAMGTWTAAANDQLYPRMKSNSVFGIGLAGHFPSKMIADLESVEGNLFNTPEIGGYLIWKLYPRKQVAIDGRWEVYGESLPELLRAFRDLETFSRLAEKHDVAIIVLDRRSPVSRQMLKWLPMSDQWRRKKKTRNALLFERSNR
jgi:hypothetical protein